MNIKDFFGKLKENELDITIKCKGGSALNVSGDGIGGFLTPDTIQSGADSIKKMCSKKNIDVNGEIAGHLEMNYDVIETEYEKVNN